MQWCMLVVTAACLLHATQAAKAGKAPKPAKPPIALSNFALLKNETAKRDSLGRSRGRATYRSGSPPETWECNSIRSVPYQVRSQLRLSTFYTKYLHAFGIPILSSSRARDEALRRACYIVVFLLADRKDIRHYLYRRNGRAGVVALSEGVTNIPEHSWLASWWNQRARGLGGTIAYPISTCGEENIMAWRGDRYPREDIFLHEFTHGIHEIGIAANGAIRDFDRRLRTRYNSLKRSGRLWARTYAMSTDREYFAEGTQSYFDVNDEQDPANGIHNYVNTREELKRYDPYLYSLNTEVFPCQNRVVNRREAKTTLPKERYYFKMNCDRNGNGILMDFKTKRRVGQKPTPRPPRPATRPPIVTGGPTPPKPDTPPPVTGGATPPKPETPPPVTEPPRPDTPAPPVVTKPPVTCRDNHRSCRYWAGAGYCNSNPGYMKKSCKKSCGNCGGGGGASCVDKNRRCRGWARRGECRKNPGYMLPNCKKSCNACNRR